MTVKKQRIVYRGEERTALYKGWKVAIMVVLDTGMKWINPTQEQVDKILAKYKVLVEAGGKSCCTIQLGKRDKQ